MIWCVNTIIWKVWHRPAAKAQTRLHIQAGLPEPLFLAYAKYGSRATCADTESFVRGGPTLTGFFIVDEGREDPNTTISGPSSARAYAGHLCYTQKKYKRHCCTGSNIKMSLILTSKYNNNTQYRKILKCIPHIICLTQTSLQIRCGSVTRLMRKSKVLHREKQSRSQCHICVYTFLEKRSINLFCVFLHTKKNVCP